MWKTEAKQSRKQSKQANKQTKHNQPTNKTPLGLEVHEQVWPGELQCQTPEDSSSIDPGTGESTGLPNPLSRNGAILYVQTATHMASSEATGRK